MLDTQTHIKTYSWLLLYYDKWETRPLVRGDARHRRTQNWQYLTCCHDPHKGLDTKTVCRNVTLICCCTERHRGLLWLLSNINFVSWRRTRYVSPKRWFSIISRETVILRFITVRNSYLRHWFVLRLQEGRTCNITRILHCVPFWNHVVSGSVSTEIYRFVH
jgi:hypothetical protein